jgi:DNA-binding NarL/FixJ family response regulator
MAIRVVIAEDHQLVADGIRKLIEVECEVVGTATDGREAVTQATKFSPEIILLDIALPQLNGLDAARQIKRLNAAIKVIFVTVQMNRDYVREAFEVGASGYVLKQASSAELLTAIREVNCGRFFLSSLISQRYSLGALSPEVSPLKLFGSLTPRQREVLQLVAEGKSAKGIAADLKISVKTVEFHKKHLMQELNLKSSAEMIRYALEQHFVSP